MKPALKAFLISIAFVSSASAQTPDPDPALNNPDKVSWELFALINKSVPSINNNVLFETWASNEDTFQQNPKFPGSSAPPNCAPTLVAALSAPLPQQPAVTPVATPKILNVPALIALAPRPSGLQPHVVPVGLAKRSAKKSGATARRSTLSSATNSTRRRD